MPHGTGAVKDRIDPRDYQYAEMSAGAAPFDWSKGYDIEATLGVKMPVKDQDGSGSCGGQAWAYYMAAIEAAATSTYEERSAKFIYSQTYVPPAGSNGRDNCNVCIKQGSAREAVLTSYNNDQPPTEAFMERAQDITDAVRYDASSAKALNYANVVPNIDLIAQAVRDNYGVVIGLTGSNNGTWGSAFPQPPINTTTDQRWYHWLYVGKAKVINGKKFIGVLNSWGTAVGEQGWQWISEDYFNITLANDYHGGSIWQVWTMVYNPAPVATFKHTFNTELKFNDTGEEVRALQMALQADGVFPQGFKLDPKSYPKATYAELTRKAVLQFQTKYAVAPMSELLSLQGKLVGAKTRAQLNKLFA